MCLGGEAAADTAPWTFDERQVQDPSSKTIQRQIDNIWALGGEIIRDLNEDPTLRRKRIEHSRQPDR
jgi:hypothetical protein